MLGEELADSPTPVADASAASGSLSSAEAARRTAAAASALAKQTMINAKDSKELADAVYAEAQAEAEKLEKLAIQARKVSSNGPKTPQRRRVVCFRPI